MRARLITGIIFLFSELAHAAYHSLRDMGYLPFELHDRFLDALAYTSTATFIAFAAAAYWHFSLRWLRVVGAFLLFEFLPIGMLILNARLGHLPPSTILIYLLQLIVAAWVYYLSAPRPPNEPPGLAPST